VRPPPRRNTQDKILSFWEVTKAELADAKAQLRVQAREAEDAAERAADALRVRGTALNGLLVPLAWDKSLTPPHTRVRVCFPASHRR
jgi:hypothetical protein